MKRSVNFSHTRKGRNTTNDIAAFLSDIGVTADQLRAEQKLKQFTDPNAQDQLEAPAYLRQTGLKGAQTRAAVFCAALERADPDGEYIKRTQEAQANEFWFEQDTD